MIWAWLLGVASVLELVFKKLEPMYYVITLMFMGQQDGVQTHR